MKIVPWIATLTAIVIPQLAQAQVENADLRIRAKFTAPRNGAWGEGQSVGGADFRVHSRFLHLYYGGVHRNDDFKFTVSFDFTGIAGFATSYSSSPYNTNFDVYINNAFVGRVVMNTLGQGTGELQYDSRHATLPALPLPANFPDPVNTFDTVRVFTAAAVLPAIGDARPASVPLFAGDLLEQFARGDVNQDRKVDTRDFAFLESNYDPNHAAGEHFGPSNGDFTGDNLCDLADYEMMAANWTDSHDIPPPPTPIAGCPADFNTDDAVNFFDYLDFVDAMSTGSVIADFNHDLSIDFFDYLDFVDRFSAGC